MPRGNCRLINETKEKRKRVISVGTTSAVERLNRLLLRMAVFVQMRMIRAYLFIPVTNLNVDALVTNFHLPESTLIMLISAFAGYDHVMNAYKIAVDEKYRFFRFRDAMFIC